MGHSLPLFLYFHLFSAIDRKQIFYEKVANDWIRTLDLQSRKRPLYQLLCKNYFDRLYFLSADLLSCFGPFLFTSLSLSNKTLTTMIRSRVLFFCATQNHYSNHFIILVKKQKRPVAASHTHTCTNIGHANAPPRKRKRGSFSEDFFSFSLYLTWVQLTQSFFPPFSLSFFLSQSLSLSHIYRTSVSHL